MVLKRR